KGDLIEVEKLEPAKGNQVTFDQVFMIGTEENHTIGTPTVKNAKVLGEIVAQGKGEKVISFKMKRRKGFKKKIGHRQFFSRVKIMEISHGN
ncbi:MAG: 50S ribosomal protein L21, partial [bacterium]|nr:50S ribosomal protein L21 [bacterium]